MQKEHTLGENRIHVTETTPEQSTDKTPIVLIHGSWGASWMWKMYIPVFVRAGYPVYALDLRGHGESGGALEGATMKDYGADVVMMVSELNIKKPMVVGHSMGGLVALSFAASSDVSGFVGIDPSPSLNVIGTGEIKEYPATYSPADAGMPIDPMEAMRALPDVSPEMLMSMKEMLGPESGVARSERKKGISIPKEKLSVPLLFVGAELGESVPFGIGSEVTKKCADYYGAEFIEIKGATHPGILVGTHAPEAAEKIVAWLGERPA